MDIAGRCRQHEKQGYSSRASVHLPFSRRTKNEREEGVIPRRGRTAPRPVLSTTCAVHVEITDACPAQLLWNVYFSVTLSAMFAERRAWPYFFISLAALPVRFSLEVYCCRAGTDTREFWLTRSIAARGKYTVHSAAAVDFWSLNGVFYAEQNEKFAVTGIIYWRAR